jgi:hypothetical protein
MVVLNDDNTVRIELDTSEFPRAYQPGHPEADEDGFVRYPNVAAPVERIDAAEARQSHELTQGILRRFDPSVVTAHLMRPIESELTDEFCILASPLARQHE